MSLIDLYVLLWLIVGSVVALAIGRIGSRRLRDEAKRDADEASRKAREHAPHASL